MKKKILFIVNPISGGLNKAFFPNLIDKYLDHGIFKAEIIFSEYIGHARKLTEDSLKNQFDIVVAVGGDGTINEVASVMESSGKLMGIIPCGSGNGLARTLKIPLKNSDAIERLNGLKIIQIDTGILNGKKFFNMAGLGFDAHISSLFAKDKNRGFGGYIKTTLNEISKYKPDDYQIDVDGQLFEQECFMLSIANSSQYGNNAHVSPTASVQDGLLDVCLIKPFPMYIFPSLGYRMFSKSADGSKFVRIVKGKEILIKRSKAGPVHLDGEPQQMGEVISVGIKHLSLNLII
ncbi:MAG: diacylglycerol kinase family lipid kinase [Bacteroidetes bacterium]|nr:diacylglycerol kinase family lipid kinase [Bacteroidota bacterium]MBU1373495.1 diacylglycerol kinase family lipid kinase [Bacteroidota bacterium]MBU1485253.1 diacylglycerol kinase family lipid kinase [Bacteroidota bacterium]MBU1760938.1 diacylglycerol kinase family lipid kinase [Bacteroidota bacterium]MBU2046284.1 diacylglycerol kinase family lipid kinase [Bacteroidota bacterium]